MILQGQGEDGGSKDDSYSSPFRPKSQLPAISNRALKGTYAIWISFGWKKKWPVLCETTKPLGPGLRPFEGNWSRPKKNWYAFLYHAPRTATPDKSYRRTGTVKS